MRPRLATKILAPALLGATFLAMAMLARPTRAAQGGPPPPAPSRPDLVWMQGDFPGGINAVAYAPNGKFLASSGAGFLGGAAVTMLWRLSDGMLIRTTTAPATRGAAFSPDSQVLADAVADGVVLWRLTDGAVLGKFTGFVGFSVTYSPDGSHLAAGGEDGNVRIFRLSDGASLLLKGHAGSVNSVAYSRDGQTIASGSADSTIRLWNADDGTPVNTWQAHELGVVQVAFSPDGQSLGSCGVENVPGGQIIVSRVWRVSDGEPRLRIPGAGVERGGPVCSVGFSADSQTFIEVQHSPLRLWRVSDGTFIRQLGVDPQEWSGLVALSPDGTLLAGERNLGGTYRMAITRLADGTALSAFGLNLNSGGRSSIAVSPDGQLVGACDSRSVSLRRASDGALLNYTSVGNGLGFAVAFSPDGQAVATTFSSSDAAKVEVQIRSVPDLTLLQTLAFPLNGSGLSALAYSPDGQLLAAVQDSVKLVRVADGTVVRTLGAGPGEGPFKRALFSPDGQYLAAGSETGSNVRLWRVTDGSLLATLGGVAEFVGSIAFSPDSAMLASGAPGGGIQLSSVPDGAPIRTLPAGPNAITALAFSPDGQTLCAGDSSVGDALGTLRFWLVADGSPLPGYDDETEFGIRSVSYSPDGKFLYYQRGDLTVAGALNPFLQPVVPDHGGNTGNVTVAILAPPGVTFEGGTGAKLAATGQADIVAAATEVVNEHLIRATFGLSGAPLGRRDVVATSPTGPVTYPRGFSVEAGGRAQTWVETRVRSRFRTGQTVNCGIDVGNAGSIDLAPLLVQVAIQPGPGPISEQSLTSLAFATPIIPPHGHVILPFPLSGDSDGCKPIVSTADPLEGKDCDELLQLINIAGTLLDQLPDGTPQDRRRRAEVKFELLQLCIAEAKCPGPTPFYCTKYFAPDQIKPPAGGAPPGANGGAASSSAVSCSSSGFDPNEFDGPAGVGDDHWRSAQEPLTYATYFSNQPTATAPAAEVVVTDYLDPTVLDLSTVAFGPVAIGDQIVTPAPEAALPGTTRNFSAEADLRPALNLLVSIDAHLDTLTGILTWDLQSIDPATGLPPDDLRGFLPPGAEGSVSFSVTLKKGLPTGTVVNNQASIVFDFNPAMATNAWFNTLDNDPPVSAVDPLAPVQNAASFPVTWAGNDVGSGLRDFTIYVSDNGGPYQPWISGTMDTTAVFTGAPGHNYAFYSAARDNAGNVEATHSQADAVTTVNGANTSPPTTTGSLAGPLGKNGWYTGPVQVTLTATDPDGPADVAATYYTLDGGAQQIYAGPFTVSTDGSHTLAFFSVDQAGNAELPNSLAFKIDATPPAITLSLFPGALIPANGKLVTIAGYGKMIEGESGLDKSTARFSVVDDYGTVQPSGAVNFERYKETDLYYFVLKLEANLKNGDPGPRNYHITVKVDDLAGNEGTTRAVVSIVRPPG